MKINEMTTQERDEILNMEVAKDGTTVSSCDCSVFKAWVLRKINMQITTPITMELTSWGISGCPTTHLSDDDKISRILKLREGGFL